MEILFLTFCPNPEGTVRIKFYVRRNIKKKGDVLTAGNLNVYIMSQQVFLYQAPFRVRGRTNKEIPDATRPSFQGFPKEILQFSTRFIHSFLY
ncbi:MAG: hypothetical protein IPG79_03510 [Saprospiraceae bacterium]|nr:hypothetical protein [Saprospiraceae bacterium]